MVASTWFAVTLGSRQHGGSSDHRLPPGPSAAVDFLDRAGLEGHQAGLWNRSQFCAVQRIPLSATAPDLGASSRPGQMFPWHTGNPNPPELRPGTSDAFQCCECHTPDSRGGFPMTPSEQFRRFAAECESMAKFTHDRENKPVWHGLAQRWVRCAELAERQSAALHDVHRRKRRRHTEHQLEDES
jgi:hypothetical protein